MFLQLAPPPPPSVFFESHSIYRGHSNLEEDYPACAAAALLISEFFLPKCSEVSYKPAQSVNKNCLNDTISPVLYCAVRGFTSPGQKVKKGIQFNYPKADTKGKAPILVFLLKSY